MSVEVWMNLQDASSSGTEVVTLGKKMVVKTIVHQEMAV